MKKYSRMMPACDEDLASEIWAYSLPKKKIGMNTRFEIRQDQVLDEERPDPKMLTAISGSGVRTSTK